MTSEEEREHGASAPTAVSGGAEASEGDRSRECISSILANDPFMKRVEQVQWVNLIILVAINVMILTTTIKSYRQHGTPIPALVRDLVKWIPKSAPGPDSQDGSSLLVYAPEKGLSCSAAYRRTKHIIKNLPRVGEGYFTYASFVRHMPDASPGGDAAISRVFMEILGEGTTLLAHSDDVAPIDVRVPVSCLREWFPVVSNTTLRARASVALESAGDVAVLFGAVEPSFLRVATSPVYVYFLRGEWVGSSALKDDTDFTDYIWNTCHVDRPKETCRVPRVSVRRFLPRALFLATYIGDIELVRFVRDRVAE